MTRQWQWPSSNKLSRARGRLMHELVEDRVSQSLKETERAREGEAMQKCNKAMGTRQKRIE